MDKLLIRLNKILNEIKLLLYKFYNKLWFLFNKQLTIQRIYVPLTESKNKANEELSHMLSALMKENSSLVKNGELLTTENKLLKNKILIMQELLLKK